MSEQVPSKDVSTQELIDFLTAWEHIGNLQTVASRNKFRMEARFWIQRLSATPEPPPSPNLYEGEGRTGVFTNCGYHGTASGWIIRDGTKWIATIGSDEEANQYVAWRNTLRKCNHSAISPKGSMFYHGFVVPTANLWRCDVCKGVYEGNLTEPGTPGSQSLTLVSSSQPPAPAPCPACVEACEMLGRAGIADGDLIDKVGDAIEAMERASNPPTQEMAPKNVDPRLCKAARAGLETSPAPTEHAIHGGRIMTLRECMEAEETSTEPRGDSQ